VRTVTPYYQDAAVTIYHGDCSEILPGILHGVAIDAVVTDPPYSISTAHDHQRKPGKGTRRLNFFPGDQDWRGMYMTVAAALEAIYEAKIPSVYTWCGHGQFGDITRLSEEHGYSTRFLVWRKSCPVPAPPGVGWDSAAELCVYAFRNGRKWTPLTGTKCPNVISADSYRHGQPGKVDHPTQKPLVTALLPVRNSTIPGDTVLDPFMGSGTTLRAAKDLGRKAIGIEVEERYCEIAARRMRQEVLL